MSSENTYAVFGYFGHENFGDCILLDVLLDELPDRSCVVVVRPRWSQEAVAADQENRLDIRYVEPTYTSLIKAFRKARNVFCFGGTCFHDKKAGFFRMQISALLARAQVEWHNVGIESTFRPSRLQSLVFRRVTRSMSVRDHASQAAATRLWGLQATFVPDGASTSKRVLSVKRRSSPNKSSLATVSIRNSTLDVNDKADAIQRALVAREPFERIIVLPAASSDVGVCRHLAERLGAQVLVLDWQGQLRALADSRLLIAERLHHQMVGHVFGVDTLSICYMEKNRLALAGAGFEIASLMDNAERGVLSKDTHLRKTS